VLSGPATEITLRWSRSITLTLLEPELATYARCPAPSTLMKYGSGAPNRRDNLILFRIDNGDRARCRVNNIGLVFYRVDCIPVGLAPTCTVRSWRRYTRSRMLTVLLAPLLT